MVSHHTFPIDRLQYSPTGGVTSTTKASSGASFHEPITGRFSAAAPIAVPSNGGLKLFGTAGLANARKKSRFASTNAPAATSWRAVAASGAVSERAAPRAGDELSRSMRITAGT